MIELLVSALADYEKLVQTVFEQNGWENPPVVRMVPSDHHLVDRPGGYDEFAVAFLTKFGKEFIVINEDYTRRDWRADMDHEIAHIIAWRTYGPKIRMHGSKFEKTCRSFAESARNSCRDRG